MGVWQKMAISSVTGVTEALGTACWDGAGRGAQAEGLAADGGGLNTRHRERADAGASPLPFSSHPPAASTRGGGDEHADAGVRVMRLGIEYRAKFGKDFLIDLVGYRRHGHNETDEPAFTQPKLYELVRSHPTPREVWGARLVRERVLTEAGHGQISTEIAPAGRAKFPPRVESSGLSDRQGLSDRGAGARGRRDARVRGEDHEAVRLAHRPKWMRPRRPSPRHDREPGAGRPEVHLCPLYRPDK